MERYYRPLFLFALLGLAVGIAGVILEQNTLGILGCLIIPAAAYTLAVLIDLFRRIGR